MPARILVPLVALALAAGGPAAPAQAGYAKVQYRATVVYRESGWSSRSWSSGSWERTTASSVFTLRSMFPFWLARNPGSPPTFSGGAALLGTAGYSLSRRWWGPVNPGAPDSEWTEGLYPSAGLRGSLGLTAGGSPRVSLGFTINERRPPRVTTHQEDGSTNTLFGMWLSGKQGRSGPLDLGRAFGRAFTASFSGSATSTTCRREHVWDPDLCRSSLVNSGTVVFTPVAWVRDRRTGARAPGPPSEERTPERTRWQVDVIGTDHWSWGVRQGLRAGVDVDWLHRTVLELKDGVIASARGKVSLRAVRGFSEPSGLFSVTVRKRQTGPEYPLPAASKPKGSRRTTLVFYDRSRAARSEYLLRYAIALTGPQALAVMRSAGVPDPDATYRTLSERGAVIDSVAPSVPDPGRLVFLLEAGRQHRPTAFFDQSVRCPQGVVDQTCFVNRGGQFVIVTKLG